MPGSKIEKKRFKRLQKVADKEVDGDEGESQVKGEPESEEDENARLFQQKRNAAAKLEEDDEGEQIDTTRKRVIETAARREPTERDRKLRENVDAAFGARKKQTREHTTTGGELEDVYDADEIDDQFATKADKLIAEIDIAERVQVKLGE